MPQSRQAAAQRVIGSVNLLRLEDQELGSLYTYYDLGMVAGMPGGDSTFFVHIYNNTVEIDYVVLEGVDQDGPFEEIDSGTFVAVPFDANTVSVSASGVFYGGVIRVGVKMSSPGSGTVSIKMLAK